MRSKSNKEKTPVPGKKAARRYLAPAVNIVTVNTIDTALVTRPQFLDRIQGS